MRALCASLTSRKPPKTAGREQFGRQYSEMLLAWGKKHHAQSADVVRTATVFTSLSIADAFRRFILPRVKVSELVVAGGGTRNPLMMAQLAAALPDIDIVSSDQFGVPAEAKEAFAFAILAYESYRLTAARIICRRRRERGIRSSSATSPTERLQRNSRSPIQ